MTRLHAVIRPVLLPALVLAAILIVAQGAHAQSCWSCQFTPPNDLDCVAGDHGRECVITCTNSNCRCRALYACKAGLAGGCETASQTVIAGDITVAGGQATVRPSVTAMRLALTASTKQALMRLPSVLSVTLMQSDDTGRLESEAVEHGLFLEKGPAGAPNQLYGYSGATTVEGDQALVEWSLIDHPDVRSLRAWIRAQGNSGIVEVVDHGGRRATYTW